jgi:hypothetical protein
MPNQQRSTLLGRAVPVVNQRHQDDVDAVAAHDKALADVANPQDKPQVEPTHNWEKRYKDLQSFNSRKINDLTSQLDAAKKAPVQTVTVPKTAEELTALREQDPDGYARIESIASAMMHNQMESYNTKLANVTNDLTQSRIDSAEAVILKAHPDFTAIANDAAFHTWADSQPTDVQDWIYNNPDRPELAIRALTLYKSERGLGTIPQTTASTNEPTGDMDVNTRSNSQHPDAVDRNHPTYIWKESEIAKMRPVEFGEWEEAISLAQREGRIAIGQ